VNPVLVDAAFRAALYIEGGGTLTAIQDAVCAVARPLGYDRFVLFSASSALRRAGSGSLLEADRQAVPLFSVLEAPAVVAGLDDVAVMGEAVQQGRGHLGVAEHTRPVGEGQVGGDDDGGALVQATCVAACTYLGPGTTSAG
jgi:hypothetical protein